MRKIGFTKYKNETKEVLPKTYKVDEITCQRKMFCTMINQYLSMRAKFELKNESLYEHSLLHIFEDKILSFFQFYKLRQEKAQRVVKIYKHESKLFNQYFKQSQNHKMRYLSRNYFFESDYRMLLGYSHPVVELIQLIFNGKEVEMMLDLNEIFARTVYSRIKKEINKKVTLDMPYIHIDQDGYKTRLHPKWKRVSKENLELRKKDIEEEFTQLQEGDIDQCYLVYPKTDGFLKHITIENGSSKSLKMIPYSFTFINRKERKCQK